MNADDLLVGMEGVLRPLVEGAGGVLEVAGSPEDALGVLCVTPRQWRVVLGWAGSGGHSAAREGMGSERFFAVVQVARGLPLRRGDGVVRRGAVRAVALMEAVEWVSGWMRGMRFADGWGVDPAGLALTGSQWLEVEGLGTVQHQLDFSVDRALGLEGLLVVPLGGAEG